MLELRMYPLNMLDSLMSKNNKDETIELCHQTEHSTENIIITTKLKIICLNVIIELR